jgi:MFS family permease
VGKWTAIVILGLAQFIMVLDGTVMNVSITTVVNDLDTSVQMMQLAIATFALTMAAFMLTGAGIGDRLGRRRTFVIGLCIYGVGSFITSIAQGFTMLFIGTITIVFHALNEINCHSNHLAYTCSASSYLTIFLLFASLTSFTESGRPNRLSIFEKRC